MCLSAKYLMNQLADFNHICMDTTFGHDKKLNSFGDLNLIFKFTANLNPPNLSQKVFACYLMDHWWNVTKFASLYKSDRINSFFDFWFGGGAHLFSLKTHIYFPLSFQVC